MNQIGELVNKSAAGVKKDLGKEKLTMEVLESYSRALNINLYEILGVIWKQEHEGEEIKGFDQFAQENPDIAKEMENTYQPSKKTITPKDRLIIQLDITGTKKEKILKILFEK